MAAGTPMKRSMRDIVLASRRKSAATPPAEYFAEADAEGEGERLRAENAALKAGRMG